MSDKMNEKKLENDQAAGGETYALDDERRVKVLRRGRRVVERVDKLDKWPFEVGLAAFERGEVLPVVS